VVLLNDKFRHINYEILELFRLSIDALKRAYFIIRRAGVCSSCRNPDGGYVTAAGVAAAGRVPDRVSVFASWAFL
jgi:hypothetical protein